MDDLFGSGIWGVLVIVGPILLAAAIAWAMLHNRTSRRKLDNTEDATRRMYDGDHTDRQSH
jgi:hypothetical protein